MKFALAGREYDYDFTLTVEEAMLLWDKASVGITKINEALAGGNPYAITAWMFILKKRAGEAIRWQDMLSLDIRTFSIIPDEPASDEEKPVKKPDPTRRGKTHTSDTSVTS